MNDREKAIAILAEHLDHWKRLLSEGICTKDEGEKTIYALTMAIKALEQTRWNPVSERLPEENGEYLVTVKRGYVMTALWVEDAENWKKVTAWMPFPEPYKAESEVEDADSN